MRRFLWPLAALLASTMAMAQKPDFSYTFYGFVRGDLFYNTRANQAPIDGNFYLYPLDREPDADGNDLNATPNGSFYTFTTRLGLDVAGPRVGKASSSAKIEVDFGGFSGNHYLLRIRQAYAALDWAGRHEVLAGVTWHPLFGDVVPDVLNLSTGAPFQPFNRSPQIRYRFRPAPALRLTAAAVWQLQYLSNGPEGASEDYIKNSLVPELYLGAEVAPAEGLTYGADAHLISLKPRVEATVDGVTRRVDERMTTYTLGAHARLKRGEWMVAAKTFLASGLDHLAMLGGFGARSEDATTGRRDYTPFRHSTSWLNVTYGTRWKTALFLGYSKNLGTDDALIDREQVYGMGLDIDQLITCNVNISYNLPHWQLGVEYCPSTAFYGTTELATGRARHTRAVTNHRVLALLMYYF